jgi:hypothetical protein
MRSLHVAPLLLAAALARCPDVPQPGPHPPPAGRGGAPSAGGSGGGPGRAGAGGAPGGFGGAFNPGSGGGVPGGDVPLCVLPPAPGADRALADFKARHAAALAALGFGSQAAWLLYREPFGARTTLVAVPPVGGGGDRQRLEQLRFRMGAGFVSVPGDGAGNGFRNPCAAEPPRVAGIGQDAPALP